MEQDSSDCVQLSRACIVLAESPIVQALVKNAVGTKDFPVTLRLMKLGKLEVNIGDTIHDLLYEEIENESTAVWIGFTHHPHGDYPLLVNEYHGVYWVNAMEFDPVGYFLDQESAVKFVRSNWENVYKAGEELEDDVDSMNEGEDDNEGANCPFCHATENCDHLLLLVDLTFRCACGGMLFETFTSKWSDLTKGQSEDEDFDESGPFDELLEEVACLSDEQINSSQNSAPGMSSAYISFFCSTKQRAQAAAMKFNTA